MEQIKRVIPFIKNWGVIIFTLSMLLIALLLKIHWIGFELKYNRMVSDLSQYSQDFEAKMDDFLSEKNSMTRKDLETSWHRYLLVKHNLDEKQNIMLEKEKIILVDLFFVFILLFSLFVLWLEVFNKMGRISAPGRGQTSASGQRGYSNADGELNMLLESLQFGTIDSHEFSTPMVRAIAEKIDDRLQGYQQFIDTIDGQIDGICDQIEQSPNLGDQDYGQGESAFSQEVHKLDEEIQELKKLTLYAKDISKELFMAMINGVIKQSSDQEGDGLSQEVIQSLQKGLVSIDEKIQQLYEMSCQIEEGSASLVRLSVPDDQDGYEQSTNLMGLKEKLIEIKNEFNRLYD